ncbi:MAG TPA: hypothetical protein VFH82_01475 [Gemmatimonadota bacterium]|jgi:hypothetical protein|nr:hypothetical protein [Gemmatimonadota bacterium]
MRLRALLLTAALMAPGCSGDGAGPTDPQNPREILVIAIARSDRSLPSEDTIEGYLAFFFDRDREVLLDAVAVVDRVNPDGSVFSRELHTEITPGLVPGVGYSEGINVDPGRRFVLDAAVTASDGSTIQVTSDTMAVPTDFEIQIPEEVAAGEGLPVTWSVSGAERVNVAVDGGVFSEHMAASLGAFTIPASAFAGRPAGELVDVEITAYNTFYEPLGAAISTLSEAETAAQKFRGIDNVSGGLGVFGAAFTLGHGVTIR